ncbi:MAG: hypothetical protein OEM02_14795 [Desulfobulbaceae bacterium]|nr:hypothetical protein [Desulfobulbaceae bacterium]
MKQGRRPELVATGLISYARGWSEEKALRKWGIAQAADDRYWGSGELVE